MKKETARFNMVEQQIRTWDVLDPNVLDACENVPREHFVPDDFESLAFSDIEIRLGTNEKMMSPKVCARAAQALSIKATDAILEIGTGSGYMAAILSRLGDNVISFEINEHLTTVARENLRTAQIENCVVKNCDGLKTSLGTYDVIMLTGAISSRNPYLERRLKNNGRMFCIIGERPSMQATLITRTGDNAWTTESLFETEINPLTGAESTKSFEF